MSRVDKFARLLTALLDSAARKARTASLTRTKSREPTGNTLLGRAQGATADFFILLSFSFVYFIVLSQHKVYIPVNEFLEKILRYQEN